jgi:RNA polymerase sigma factor (sigma-70 family)
LPHFEGDPGVRPKRNRSYPERTILSMGAILGDQDDWALAVRGDGRAMARIYDRHHARLHRQASSLVLTAADADDVVATVYLEAWRRRERARFVDGSLLPWLLTTATYCAKNLARTSRRYRGFLDRFPRDDGVERDPADALDDGAARDALRKLSLKDQEVITLCVLENLNEGEAAHVLGVPAGTIKSRLHRAQHRLRQQYVHPFSSMTNESQEVPHEA